MFNILFSTKGEKGDVGYEGIPGFQGVKVFVLNFSPQCLAVF